MPATPTSQPNFEAWRARVIGYARAVLGLEIDGLSEEELRDGFSLGESPPEFCGGALAATELPRRRVRDPRHATLPVADSMDAITSGR